MAAECFAEPPFDPEASYRETLGAFRMAFMRAEQAGALIPDDPEQPETPRSFMAVGFTDDPVCMGELEGVARQRVMIAKSSDEEGQMEYGCTTWGFNDRGEPIGSAYTVFYRETFGDGELMLRDEEAEWRMQVRLQTLQFDPLETALLAAPAQEYPSQLAQELAALAAANGGFLPGPKGGTVDDASPREGRVVYVVSPQEDETPTGPAAPPVSASATDEIERAIIADHEAQEAARLARQKVIGRWLGRLYALVYRVGRAI